MIWWNRHIEIIRERSPALNMESEPLLAPSKNHIKNQLKKPVDGSV